MSVRGHVVPLSFHQRLLNDTGRMRALRRAIRAIVRPGDHVLDVGAGTGILTLWALEAGASHVFAVEPHGVIEVARRLVGANGGAGRVTFIDQVVESLCSADVGGAVDVVLAEAMGNFFVTDCMQPALRHAATLLAPEGRMMPDRIRLYTALCAAELPPLAFWSTHIGEIDLRSALPLARQEPLVVHISPRELLSGPAQLADFSARDAADELELTASLEPGTAGTLTGLACWFDAEMGGGHTARSGPGVGSHWGQVFLPLPPVDVEPTMTVSVGIRTRRIDTEPVRCAFHWSVEVRRAGDVVARFEQDSEWIHHANDRK